MKVFNLGVVGLGKLGYLHARNIARNIPNARLVAVCDQNKEMLEKAKVELGVEKVFTDFEDMLKNGNIDGVAIISPSIYHYEHIELAVSYDLPIFCEKPLGTSLEQIYKIEEMFKEKAYDKTFMLGFMRRFDQSYMKAKQMILDGVIGNPYMIRCYGLDPIKYVKTAVPFAEKSGGIFLDMAIHDIDLARWFMASEVKTIFAQGDCYVEDGFAEFDDVDNGTAIMRFENGAMGLFFTSRTCYHGYHIETEITGSKGSIRIGGNPNNDEVVLFTSDGANQTYKDYFMDRFMDAYRNEVQEFVNCALKGEKASVGLIDGIKSTEIAYGCNQSYKEDVIVRL